MSDNQIPGYTPPASLDDYPAQPVTVYTTLRDDPDSTISAHVGVFSDEELARDAAQRNSDEDWENQPADWRADNPRPVVTWGNDDQSHPLMDGSIYTVIQTTLDVPTGQG